MLHLDKIRQAADIYLLDGLKNKQICPQETHGTRGDSIWIKAFQNVSSEAVVAAAWDEVNAPSQLAANDLEIRRAAVCQLRTAAVTDGFTQQIGSGVLVWLEGSLKNFAVHE